MARSIQEMSNNFKQLLRDDAFFYGVLIVLVSVASFGLGRWSVLEKGVEALPKEITPAAVVLSTTPTSTVAAKEVSSTSVYAKTPTVAPKYVGSRTGSKYHLLWCPGAKTIKESNKVYFGSKEEAEKAGYTPAANCKGI